MPHCFGPCHRLRLSCPHLAGAAMQPFPSSPLASTQPPAPTSCALLSPLRASNTAQLKRSTAAAFYTPAALHPCNTALPQNHSAPCPSATLPFHGLALPRRFDPTAPSAAAMLHFLSSPCVCNAALPQRCHPQPHTSWAPCPPLPKACTLVTSASQSSHSTTAPRHTTLPLLLCAPPAPRFHTTLPSCTYMPQQQTASRAFRPAHHHSTPCASMPSCLQWRAPP